MVLVVGPVLGVVGVVLTQTPVMAGLVGVGVGQIHLHVLQGHPHSAVVVAVVERLLVMAALVGVVVVRVVPQMEQVVLAA